MQQQFPETKNELKKLIRYLRVNGYEVDIIDHANNANHTFQDDIEASFIKNNLYVDDGNGGMANDSHIIVRVEFDSRADVNNHFEDPVEDGYRYRGAPAAQFVYDLYDDIPNGIPNGIQSDDSRIQTDDANGGSKKRRKTRKTRKNKKK